MTNVTKTVTQRSKTNEMHRVARASFFLPFASSEPRWSPRDLVATLLHPKVTHSSTVQRTATRHCWGEMIKTSPSFFTVVVLWFLSCVAGRQGGVSAEDDHASLYLYQHQQAKPVQEVTDPDDSFLESNKPRIVEFYSPHCVRLTSVMIHE